MLRLTASLLVLLFYSQIIHAQVFNETTSPQPDSFTHSVYLEFGGSTVTASANYELIYRKSTAFRIGITPFPDLFGVEDDDYLRDTIEQDNMEMVAMISAARLFGSGPNKFESGIGAVFGQSKRNPDSRFPRATGITPYLGYRFTPQEKVNGVVFRASFTPIINSDGFNPWFGLSFGYSFAN